MDYLKIFDYLSVITLAFLSYGVLSQWWYIYKSKSVKDILTKEVVIRFLATFILWIKMLLVKDIYLIMGQTIFLIAVLTYTLTLIKIKLKQ